MNGPSVCWMPRVWKPCWAGIEGLHPPPYYQSNTYKALPMDIDTEAEVLTLSISQIEDICSTLLREVFYASYELRFGKPSSELCRRVDSAEPLELKSWIPHITIAEKDEDIFVSELEYVLAQYVSSVAKRKLGRDLGKTFSLKELADRLRADNPLPALESDMRSPSERPLVK